MPFIRDLLPLLRELNDLKRIRVADRKDLGGAMLITGFPPRERERASAQLKCVDSLLLQAEDIRRTGSAALDLAYVAAGRADRYFEAGLKPWDIAAGSLLVAEAGGVIRHISGEPFDVLRGDVIASAPALAPALLAEAKRFVDGLREQPPRG